MVLGNGGDGVRGGNGRVISEEARFDANFQNSQANLVPCVCVPNLCVTLCVYPY
jgi:hypothetical protein